MTKTAPYLLVSFWAAACGSEHRIGVDPPDGGTMGADARTTTPGQKDAANNSGPGDGGSPDAASPPSALENVVATLVEETLLASGEVDDHYRISFVVHNGEQQDIVSLDRVVVTVAGQSFTFNQPPSCADDSQIPGMVTSPIAHADLTFKSRPQSEVVFEGGCGPISKFSDHNPPIPTELRFEVNGLYRDGAPYSLGQTVTTVDGR